MKEEMTSNKLKISAITFGVILIVIGILGFVPQVMENGNLFGLFHVNTAHNIVHLLSGLVALWCGLNSEHASRIYFQVFGIIYGIVALLGLYYQDRNILGVIANNVHDIWLHALISLVALYLGFGCCCVCNKDKYKKP